MTIGQAYKKIIEALNGDECEQEAAEILRALTGFEKGTLFLNLDKPFANAEKLNLILKRRLKGEPLAYILNVRSFYGYDFYVDERCLIPRYDSECGVEYAVSLIRKRGYKRILDLCSGSGCLGLSILKCLREEYGLEAEGDFSDISEGAMEVLIKNAAELLNFEPQTYLGDLYIPNNKKYDLIICNPPYIDIEEREDIEEQVKDYEPNIALFAQKEGLVLYPEIAKKAFCGLIDGGTLICEIGSAQKDAVMRIFEEAGFRDVISGCDLASRDRFISGEK